MKITTDDITTLATGSVDAVMCWLPASTASRRNYNCDLLPVDPTQADALVIELVRVSAGPVVLIALHDADAWCDALERHGRVVSRASYIADSFDVVVGAGRPITLPDNDMPTLRDLVEQLSRIVAVPGQDVLVPMALTGHVALAVQAAGRRPIVLARSSIHADSIRGMVAGGCFIRRLDDATYAEVIARMKAGETVGHIARSLSLANAGLYKRLAADGHRALTRKRRTKAAPAAA